ncbi:muts domain V-domain-containing protein [Suillus clintonianus]|uniref:muts domain V-domain-containing protein n=1 Tax=Suillus clintonianus TaxID=1904413 RepID=UPI001B85BD57|nr:muts domain V-domain-containing protein [Suillus clintonianus]KAG2157395.1 muts domain V-domain-containing protein [Suillus clintonianus]
MRERQSASRHTQPQISSFFVQSPATKKRAPVSLDSPIDLTLDDSDVERQPPIKKLKSKHPESPTSQWRFDTSSRGEHSGTASIQEHKTRSRADFERILLGTGRQSGYADDKGNSSADDDSSQNGNDSDPAFTELRAMFSLKPTKGKGKSCEKSLVRKTKAAAEIGPSGETYTPYEVQALSFIKDHPGTILMIEKGYKFYFHEESAKIASGELGIIAYMKRNLLTASIPVHRKEVHMRKLLSKGHKVGIVEQTETAALKKAGDNKNTLFERKLAELYTAATYVDEVGSVDDLDKYSAPPLLCLVEARKDDSAEGEISIGMIAITPSTGDVIWDEFHDTVMRVELETRLVHTRPAELLVAGEGLTKMTRKVLAHFTNLTASSASHDQRIRTEHFNSAMSGSEAFDFITNFYTTKSTASTEELSSDKILAIVAGLPQLVAISLAQSIKYLSSFSIADAFLGVKFFTRFTERCHMLLNGNTMTNLEIYQNQTDFTTQGTLMSVLDHTSTKFGARLLKNWIGKPLTNKLILNQRIDAVEEIKSSKSPQLVELCRVLKRLPDLAKGLCRIQYGKCTCQELASLLSAFQIIVRAFPERSEEFHSKLLNDIFSSLPKLKAPIKTLLGAIDIEKATSGRKDELWTDPEQFPALDEYKLLIETVKSELDEELKSIRKLLRKPSLTWKTVAGTEYLAEIKKSEDRMVPTNWVVVSATKYLRRYHTPEVKKFIDELSRYKEALNAEANKAFASFLSSIASDHYSVMRDAVNKLAIADCLLSLAHVAHQQGYVRPEFIEGDSLEIVEGRHPMIEALRTDPFVPNTLYMGGDHPRSSVITGPNMGGKSSAVRMVALIVIMAQIGSYVPAQVVRLGLLDGVLSRMGASDELARGRSTFMVEMAQTSDILQKATHKSLVILDELGRGFTQMAIADAVLHHLVERVKCKTLFITHYPLVATELERKFPEEVQNLHMSYTTETRINGTRDVTFLYQLTPGVALESFGVECGRLAGLPDDILRIASERSELCRTVTEQRIRRSRSVCMLAIHLLPA